MTNDISLKTNNPFYKVSGGFSIPEYNVYGYPAQIIPPTQTVTPKKAETPAQIPIPSQYPPKDSFVKKEEGENKDKKKPLGKIVLYSMLTAGAVALLLAKGLSGSAANKLKLFLDRRENDFLRFASKNKTAGYIDEKICRYSQGARRWFSLTNALANITALKDNVVHKITSCKLFNNRFIKLQKICDKATEKTLKITQSAVDSKYNAASSALDSLEAHFRELLSQIQKKDPKKAEIIRSKIDDIISIYRCGFSKSTRDVRLNDIRQALLNIDKEVAADIVSPFVKESNTMSVKKGIFGRIADAFKRLTFKKDKFKDVYSSYITQNHQAAAQNLHKHKIERAKIILSNDLADVNMRFQTISNDLKHCFKPEDKDCRLMYGDLLEKFEKFKQFSRSEQITERTAVQKEILAILGEMKKKMSDFIITGKKGESLKYSAKELTQANKLIHTMENAVKSSSHKGLLQKILTDMKGSVDKDSYTALKSHTEKFNKLLNDAINLEGGDMVNKYAEAKVGSIVTDLMGLGLMAGTGAYAVSKGKDKEERIGATLNVATPLIGTIGAYFYSAAKAFSGVKALGFAALTGYVFNKIGSTIFNYYKKRYVENKSIKEIAKETYDNATDVKSATNPA